MVWGLCQHRAWCNSMSTEAGKPGEAFKGCYSEVSPSLFLGAGCSSNFRGNRVLGVTQVYKNSALSNANPDCSGVLFAQYPCQRAGRPLFSSQT